MKSVAFHNLGCKVNAYELDVMQQILQKHGYEIVQFSQKADIYVVNTCTVTNIADRKSRQMLHRAKQMNPEAIVIAVGCYVQTGKEALLADGSVDLLIGNNHKSEIGQILEAFLKERESAENPEKEKTVVMEDLVRPCNYEDMMLEQTAEHTRAYIKIQDGCNQFCSYCAIPLARGRVRSRSKEDIIAEIKLLMKKGYREVVLTGIHISSYGVDFDGQVYRGNGHLVDLIEEICAIEGLRRVRLGSIEPQILSPEAAKRLAALPNLCPHFHLSLQSGCDDTLKRMNRHYTIAEFSQGVRYLRDAFDKPAITTDVIVGFPGETEDEFAQTVEFLEQICFYEMHVFKYSKRDHTVAAKMPNQIGEDIKGKRSDVLLEMEHRQSKAFREAFIGQMVDVLLEEEKQFGGKHYFVGHTREYVKVAVEKNGTLEDCHSNSFVKVCVASFLTDEVLTGNVI